MLLSCEFLQIDGVLVLQLAGKSRPLHISWTHLSIRNKELDLAEDTSAPNKSPLSHAAPRTAGVSHVMRSIGALLLDDITTSPLSNSRVEQSRALGRRIRVQPGTYSSWAFLWTDLFWTTAHKHVARSSVPTTCHARTWCSVDRPLQKLSYYTHQTHFRHHFTSTLSAVPAMLPGQLGVV
jgi:hypothetical protein